MVEGAQIGGVGIAELARHLGKPQICTDIHVRIDHNTVSTGILRLCPLII